MNGDDRPWDAATDLHVSIFAAVASAVAHMHAQLPSIVHRDLKVENVLVDGDRVYLCDFGSASIATDPLYGPVRPASPPCHVPSLTAAGRRLCPAGARP